MPREHAGDVVLQSCLLKIGFHFSPEIDSGRESGRVNDAVDLILESPFTNGGRYRQDDLLSKSRGVGRFMIVLALTVTLAK